MKLLLLGLEDHRRPGSGGGSQRNHEVNGRLASRGHEILVLVADHRGSCARVEDGVRYQHLGIPFGYKPSLVAYHAMLPLVLPRLVHEFDPDVLVEEFAPPVSSVGICRLWRRPSVGLVHGYFAREKAAQYHLPLRPTLAIERWGTRSHRYLITNSWDVAQELKANAPGSQVVICGTGLDHDAITAAVGDEDARLRLTSARHIVYLGRLEFHQKGLDLLLEALDSIAGDDWRLSIAGDGPDATRLSAAVEQAPWRDKVTLLGRVAGPEKWRLLASGAVFVMPSRYETFGRVALEAMSVGTPVAAFEIANLRDTLGTDAALMAQPFDTAALGQALLRAIGDTEWSGRAAQAALARSRKRNWDAVALEHEAVYRAALEGHDVVTDEALKPVVAATDGDLPLAAGSGSGQQVGANAPGPPPVATAPVGKYGTGKRQRQKKGKGIGVSSASGEYDYVIAGGGTAGCILAGLLSRRPDVTVLLIEAGRRDHSPLIHLPSGTGQLRPSVYDWGFSTVPQAHCDGRRIPYRQAKVLGGGGSVNAQVYTRGAPADYDDWAKEHRCVGWSYDEVLPYFVRSEANTRLSAPWHGSDGPLAVSDLAVPNPVSLAFVRAGQEFGLPYNPDFNGATQYGVGLYQSTTRNGQRCSAATAYLRPARGRPNLRVETGWLARRVLFEGERAVGV
ncbi:MAG TPA: GMC family oxidoreductase N-terminal domain-containing protein, partial [Acidimicrobiales bacterium]|nr:GMC family oxidoreductase N-terminal domain-containing protein [Acidimicrobiales bacterium]